MLDEESRKSPIELGCDVAFNDSILRYVISYDSKAIQHESLALLDGKSESKLIDRSPSGEVNGELISRSDGKELYVKEIQPNVTVFVKASQHGPHRGKE